MYIINQGVFQGPLCQLRVGDFLCNNAPLIEVWSPLGQLQKTTNPLIPDLNGGRGDGGYINWCIMSTRMCCFQQSTGSCCTRNIQLYQWKAKNKYKRKGKFKKYSDQQKHQQLIVNLLTNYLAANAYKIINLSVEYSLHFPWSLMANFDKPPDLQFHFTSQEQGCFSQGRKIIKVCFKWRSKNTSTYWELKTIEELTWSEHNIANLRLSLKSVHKKLSEH